MSALITGMCILLSSCASSGDDSPPAQAQAATHDQVDLPAGQLAAVTVGAAEAREFASEISATGRVALDDDRTTPIVGSITGRVDRVLVMVGDRVEAGAPLLELDSPDVAQAEADALAAQATARKSHATLTLAQRGKEIAAHSLQLAEAASRRQERLLEDRTVAEKDVEQAQRDLDQGQRDAEQATTDLANANDDVSASESAFAAARHRLEILGKTTAEIDALMRDRVIDRRITMRATANGTVISRKVAAGQFIRQDNADALFTIADLSTVWLVADVPECDLPSVKIGQPVHVRLEAFPGEVIEAHVEYVSPAVDPATRRGQVRCMAENPQQRLKTDMYGTFRIATHATTSPSVPTGAVIRCGSHTYVWQPTGSGGFLRHEVRVGLSTGDGVVQILDGISAGDRIVTAGALYIDDAANG
jgi:cobalt-zinc-cadmium efflux system membrane fusion protein